jgi:hypothetical protein
VCGANKSAPERKATSAAHPDELKLGTNPAAVATTQRQEEASRGADAEQLPERGSPVEVQLKLHQKETGREAGAENFPGWGALWSLKTDASGEMRRPIIEAEMEEACCKRDGNGEEMQESCGNGGKRPAGIAASQEEWEDFVREVEDKGDEDDPQYATRSQAGHPVPAGHESCPHPRWEPGKLHSELREKKEIGPVRNSPSFDAATGRRTNRGSVSPAYGYIALALVKCSNEGGPGPRYNRKEDPGSSIFSMLVVYGYYLHRPLLRTR